ncbi:MAG: hypothetical protein GY859_35985 [Desulfobacterales bacterium]|nr:hypothetical protein [Desulfobacterales bacterium]
MTEQPLDIPKNLRDPFKRMIGLMPKALRDDEFQGKATLAFLKVGGERLARHHVKVASLLHKDDLATRKSIFGARPVKPVAEEETKPAEVKQEAAPEKEAEPASVPAAKEAPPPAQPVDDFYM